MKKLILALLLSGIAGSAFAADDGAYIAVNVGQSSTDTYSLSSKTATGVGGLLGYQFNKYLGVEVQYTDFGSITPQKGSSSNISAYGLNAVGTLTHSLMNGPLFSKWGLLIQPLNHLEALATSAAVI